MRTGEHRIILDSTKLCKMSSSSEGFPHFTMPAAGSGCLPLQLRCVQVGARGYDEWGAMFASSMKRSMVGIGKMRIQQGPTGFTSPMRIMPLKLPLYAFCLSAPHVCGLQGSFLD